KLSLQIRVSKYFSQKPIRLLVGNPSVLRLETSKVPMVILNAVMLSLLRKKQYPNVIQQHFKPTMSAIRARIATIKFIRALRLSGVIMTPGNRSGVNNGAIRAILIIVN